MITLKLLATNENREKQQVFGEASEPRHKKLVILLNSRYLITSVAPDDPALI